MIEGDHNSPRSRFFMDSVAIFFLNALRIDVRSLALRCRARH